MHQSLLAGFARLRVQPRNLLPAGMKITSYNHHAKAPSSPGALVLKPRLPGRSSLRSYPINLSRFLRKVGDDAVWVAPHFCAEPILARCSGGRDRSLMKTSIRNFVLRAIADDYEDFEMVFSEATKWASEDGRIRVTREEVIRGLEKLIEEGYAKAYLLSSQPPHAKPVPFS